MPGQKRPRDNMGPGDGVTYFFRFAWNFGPNSGLPTGRSFAANRLNWASVIAHLRPTYKGHNRLNRSRVYRVWRWYNELLDAGLDLGCDVGDERLLAIRGRSSAGRSPPFFAHRSLRAPDSRQPIDEFFGPSVFRARHSRGKCSSCAITRRVTSTGARVDGHDPAADDTYSRNVYISGGFCHNGHHGERCNHPPLYHA